MTKLLTVKKITLGLVVICAFGLFTAGSWRLGYFSHLDNSKQSKQNATNAGEARLSVFKQVAQPIFLPPKTIVLGAKTIEVEQVGVEEGGELGVPSGWYTAGWYKDGAKVGEVGNMIIDGHYDTNTGAPGAFWGLKDLQVGDKVWLTDSLERRFEYSVVEKSYISITDPKRTEVFANSRDRLLTLITCGGVWDYASGTYNRRLIIKAQFAKMEKGW
ncbi:class F sortase [Patescibacteria group bacterium]|nr:class F sortase [Patescibacteria group bacterium]